MAGPSKDDTQATSHIRYPAIQPPIAATPPIRFYLRSRTTSRASDMAAAITQNRARFLHLRGVIINGVWQSCWESRITRHPALHLWQSPNLYYIGCLLSICLQHIKWKWSRLHAPGRSRYHLDGEAVFALVEAREHASIQLRAHY